MSYIITAEVAKPSLETIKISPAPLTRIRGIDASIFATDDDDAQSLDAALEEPEKCFYGPLSDP